MTNKPDDPLDVFFDAARDDEPRVSVGLMARVVADAEALQPDAQTLVKPTKVPSNWSFWEMFGGWPAFGSVAAAGVAGLWLGVAPPLTVEQIASDLIGTTTAVSFIDDFDGLTEEGADG